MTNEVNNEVELQTGASDAALQSGGIDPALQSDEGEIALSEFIEVFMQRSATYMFLSRLYHKEIDQKFLDEMHGMLYPAENFDEDLYTGNLYIATYLSNLWSGSLNELKIDFSRCFLSQGIDGYSAAYPFESVYTSEKRLMMDAARSEVLAIYRANGVEKQSSWKEEEDHISLELEFMRIMCEKTIQAFQDEDSSKAQELLTVQYDFLENHLLSWVPMLFADMRKFAKTKMYLGLTYLTWGFLKTDFYFLKDLLVSPEEA